MLYLGEYRSKLIASELDSLRAQSELFAGALGASAVTIGPAGEERLSAETSRPIIRRLVDQSRLRARLFDIDGQLLADSFRLVGPGGRVEIQELPASSALPPHESWMADLYDWVVNWLPRKPLYPPYHEPNNQSAADYEEAVRALGGESDAEVRQSGDGGLVLTVAVPVQRYRQVLGALMLSRSGAEITQAVREVRFDILKVFTIALAITVLLSIYLAGTIARPIRKLADAAERVRRGHGRHATIPDFTRRGDEVGDLSGALRDMTEALWQRMDGIERFAADVAHELKNPLSSMRSAVETVARLDDPEQQKKLIQIILDDVQRLDRLISDISDASRLDAELSRAEGEPVDMGEMLGTLVEVYRATAAPDGPVFEFDRANNHQLGVQGIERRLVQVFRNLISNAISFSPPGGVIRVRAWREGNAVRATVSDQGPGIPDGKLEAIFDRFYSERPVGEKFGTHSGLGLSISKQVVQAHGGSIWSENRTDSEGRVVGARFVVELPARS
ncbi:MAG: chvG [Rhodospirillales bacterium]|nr:chvG [Rhodospirillales bacterium]